MRVWVLFESYSLPLQCQKLFDAQAGFPNDRSQRPARDRPRMVWHRRAPTSLRVIPDLVAAFRLAIEFKAGRSQALHDLAIRQSRQPRHACAGSIEMPTAIVAVARRRPCRFSADRILG